MKEGFFYTNATLQKKIYQYAIAKKIFTNILHLSEVKSFLPRTTLEVVHAKNDFHCTYLDAHQLRNIT